MRTQATPYDINVYLPYQYHSLPDDSVSLSAQAIYLIHRSYIDFCERPKQPCLVYRI